MSVIPHRDPVLLVDDIIDYEAGKWAIGHTHLTGGERAFSREKNDAGNLPA